MNALSLQAALSSDFYFFPIPSAQALSFLTLQSSTDLLTPLLIFSGKEHLLSTALMNQSKVSDNVALRADSFVFVSAAPGEVLGQSGALEMLISHAGVLKGCALSWWQGKKTALEDKMGNILNKASHAHHRAECQDEIIPVNKE